jgi:D-alanyl-lipoteichoic acid acyltransferase DltB (MBOAT superfamily)
MSLLNILILIAAALVVRLVFPGKLRRWALLVTSVLAIYWLQSALPIRGMDFWFPTATLGLTLLSWGLTAEKDQFEDRGNWLAAGLAAGTVLLIALTRFVSLEGVLTPTRPPQFYLVLIALVVIFGLTAVLVRYFKATGGILSLGILALILIFIVLKNPLLSMFSSIGLRQLMSQDPALAKATDLGWLGFSYVAFRLLHTLIDRMNGRLKDIKLGEYVIYTIFFPAFLAGPLDRLQRFRKDLVNPKPLDAGELEESGVRLAKGLFRKFILADSLAFVALSAAKVTQTESAGWLWLMLVAYSFQLFLDFAGYTDIAIGMGLLLGFRLPENFNQPYRQPNLTLFWNNWHMTLTQWIRGYFFNPITRALRRKRNLPAPLIIFITQMSTMIVIGLWHGVTANFIIWGAWHGLGLFVHNRWNSFIGPKLAQAKDDKPWLPKALNIGGVVLTFVFVSLGWVWFALPTTSLALQTFVKLFGIGS